MITLRTLHLQSCHSGDEQYHCDELYFIIMVKNKLELLKKSCDASCVLLKSLGS